jgi:hypothetical protein
MFPRWNALVLCRKTRHWDRAAADCVCALPAVAIIVRGGGGNRRLVLFHFSTPWNIPPPRHCAAKLVDSQIVPAIGELVHYRECRQRCCRSCLGVACDGRTSGRSCSFRAYFVLSWCNHICCVRARYLFQFCSRAQWFVVLFAALNTIDCSTYKRRLNGSDCRWMVVYYTACSSSFLLNVRLVSGVAVNK